MMERGKLHVAGSTDTSYLKPQFLFGDKLASYKGKILKMKDDWYIDAKDISLYVPKIERQLLLSTFTCLASKRQMNWEHTPTQGGSACGFLQIWL